MSILEIILIPLGVIWIAITYLVAGAVALGAEDYEYNINKWILTIRDLVCELFSGKNLFGIILSIVLLIIFTPSLLIILIVQIFGWLFEFLEWLWILGNK